MGISAALLETVTNLGLINKRLGAIDDRIKKAEECCTTLKMGIADITTRMSMIPTLLENHDLKFEKTIVEKYNLHNLLK